MEPFHVAYITVWAGACLAALTLVLAKPSSYEFMRSAYWRFLAHPWKVMTFVVALAGLALIAPYTGDPTWDYVDATFMSMLAFCTAPWAIAVLYRSFRNKALGRESMVALCAWLFSAGWSYDLYLLLRDGYYPVTWSANLFESSLLYVSAGLFWNLHWTARTGMTFAFTLPGWPSQPTSAPLAKIIWPALLLMGLVSAMILPFLML